METIESLIEYCRDNKRVCPQPMRWNELYEMLPNKQRVGLGWEPAPPLILAAWWETPAMSKQIRLAEHIEWAEKNGVLEKVSIFLHGLPEKEWYHLGE